MSLPRAGLGVLGVLRLADDGPKGDDRRDCHDPKHIHAPLLHLRHTRPADDRYFDPIAGHLLETCLRAEGAWRRPRMDHASAGRTMYGEICLCPVWCPPHDDVMHPAGPAVCGQLGSRKRQGRGGPRNGPLVSFAANWRPLLREPPARPRSGRGRAGAGSGSSGRAADGQDGWKRGQRMQTPTALPVELSGGFRGLAAPRRWRRPRGPP